MTSKQPNYISRDDLLDELTRLHEKLVKTPRKVDMDKYGEYHGSTYQKRFGSWKDALCKAGIQPSPQNERISNDDLIKDIKRVANEIDDVPSTIDMKEKGKYSLNAFYRRCETWDEALIEAGFDPADNDAKHISDEELISELHRLNEKLNRPPASNDIREYGKHSFPTYQRRFDGWIDALEKAKIEPHPIQYNKRHYEEKDNKNTPNRPSKKELLLELQQIANTYGEPLKTAQIKKHGKYKLIDYYFRFGSWEAAVNKAGSEPAYGNYGNNTTQEEVISKLEQIAEDLQCEPTVEDIREANGISLGTIRGHFKGLRDAKTEANLIGPSVEDLFAELQRVSQMVNGQPTPEDMNEHGEYNADVYEQEITEWETLLNLADLPD